jgi:hypothetical protein
MPPGAAPSPAAGADFSALSSAAGARRDRGSGRAPERLHVRRVAVNAGDDRDVEPEPLDPREQLGGARARADLVLARIGEIRLDQNLLSRQIDHLHVLSVRVGQGIEHDGSVAVAQGAGAVVRFDRYDAAALLQGVGAQPVRRMRQTAKIAWRARARRRSPSAM